MQTKNVVSSNLKEFVLGLEQAVKEGYSVVEEGVNFHAGYFKALTQKEEVIDVLNNFQEPTILDSATALEMLDNPGEPAEELKEVLDLDKPEASVAAKPKRQRK